MTSKLTATDKKLQSMGLVTDYDLVFHLPLRYEDLSRIHKIAEAVPGNSVQLEGFLQNVQQRNRGGRREIIARLADQTGSLQLRWIHTFPGQVQQLQRKSFVRVRGEIRGSAQWGFEIIHPKISAAGAPLPEKLQPIYPTTQGLQQDSLRKRIVAALGRADFSEIFGSECSLPAIQWPLAQALKYLHQPPADADLQALTDRTHPAWMRIKHDEILAQQLAMSLARQERQRLKAVSIGGGDNKLGKAVLEKFGNPLTNAQARATQEILADMRQSHPMRRLVQGDVGCGKTIVAALAAAQAVEQGLQVAVMAPTEILAQQLYLKFSHWFSGAGIKPAWLSSSLKASVKKQIGAGLQDGSILLVVGTQALIQKNIEFKNLGLIIVDEQHRFGVGQRLTLSQKGENEQGVHRIVPHQLTMSATPIPRTLALAFFSDLDVSVIDELPPAKKPVTTKLINADRREELLQSVHTYCRGGQQIYWVCPLIEESEALQLETALSTYEFLQHALPDLKIGLLHGKLSSDEKSEIMDSFKSGDLNILVATTVIEVGVDVPAANLIIIEHAERFGLSQLHQLRGRVGRGQEAATCILMYQTPLSQLARERLRAMYESSDGFEIARRDLEQRGPGEFLGLRQSGSALMRFADFDTDARLIDQIRQVVPSLLADYPMQVQAHLARWRFIDQDYLRS